MAACVRIRTLAKVNLYLEVLGRRADGYHDVVSVMQSVTLADDLEIEERPSGIEVVCDAPGVPTDESNLVARAWRRFRLHAGGPDGLRVRIGKRIPVAAGLGGGSANAAGVLAGLSAMRGGRPDLARLAAEVGSDVPFFLEGGTRLAGGRGTDLEPLPALPPCWIVLACPDVRVETRWAYGRLKLPLTRDREFLTMILAGLRQGDARAVAGGLFNRFERVVFGAYPELDDLKGEMLRRDALGVVLSGSGPTLLAVSESQETASALSAWLSKQGVRSFVTEPARKGLELL